MKLTVARKDLAKALEFAARVAQKRTTIPILANLLIRAEVGRLTIAATDLDIEGRTSIEAEISAPGATTVPAATFHDIARKLDSERVTLDLDAEKGRLAIKAGRSKFHLATISEDDWPTLEAGEMSHNFALPAATLARAFKKVSFAISNEETRYYLNGVFLHRLENDLLFVATDGHRLAKFGAPGPASSENMPGVIVPARACAELARLAEASVKESTNSNIEIALSDRKILFRGGDATILSKLIDGSYPDYQRVIPQTNDKVASLRREALGPALERVATIVRDRGRAVKFSFDQSALTLTVNNADMGDAVEDIEADYDAPPIEMGFNARYVADALAAIDGDHVRLELNDSGSPAIVRANPDADVLVVLMPMRV